ncbi:hypothetical protein MHBO_003636 [Bonamia ostreae]|uniref:ATP-dependent RNA helicase n=1 Tax=Bonamia ostreae TaxID=126728 RepID=A0ABV2AR56_9EUKA
MSLEENEQNDTEAPLGAKLSKDDQIETNWGEISEQLGVPEIVERFEDMEINPKILRGLFTYGFEEPSSIQQRGVIAVNTGRHVIAQAQSGTGKTATFVLGTLNRIDLDLPKCQVLVLAPTRELANQIYDVYNAIGYHLKADGFEVLACVGGTSVDEDQRALRKGVHIVVGTPGRVRHLAENGDLQLKHIRSFVLDEAFPNSS